MAKVRKRLVRTALAVATIGTAAGIAFSTRLALRQYTVRTRKLTSPVKVLLLSDLHSTTYGKDQSILVQRIRELKPDIVALVGDIFDENRNPQTALKLLIQLGHSYSCFYVTGNHEFKTGIVDRIKQVVQDCGINVMDGRCKIINVNGQTVQICGVDDPNGFHKAAFSNIGISAHWGKQLDKCERQLNSNAYKVLLSHRPERASYYSLCSFDLVLTGHAHGGQVIAPGVFNGLYAPNQGLFPKYAGGVYILDNGAKMVVSRGLAKSFIPRIFNPPEMVLINLQPGE